MKNKEPIYAYGWGEEISGFTRSYDEANAALKLYEKGDNEFAVSIPAGKMRLNSTTGNWQFLCTETGVHIYKGLLPRWIKLEIE